MMLTLSPCGRGSLREAKRGEGFGSADTDLFEMPVLADRDPSSVADFVRATFSHKGRRLEGRCRDVVADRERHG
jgi:hypothetical protein